MTASESRPARQEVAAGLTVLGLASLPTLRLHPPGWELASFSAVNRLPDALHPPIWAVMQLGAFGAAPATAAVALAAGDRALAGRLLAGGTAAWLAAKVVKRFVRRARPGELVAGARLRGRPCAGHGFPSGHAGVATALAGAALVSADPGLEPLLVALAATVGASRVYVGAHLPLDVVGGAALGLVVDGALRLFRSAP